MLITQTIPAQAPAHKKIQVKNIGKYMNEIFHVIMPIKKIWDKTFGIKYATVLI